MQKESDVVCTRWSNYRDVHAPTNMLRELQNRLACSANIRTSTQLCFNTWGSQTFLSNELLPQEPTSTF